LYSFYSSVTVLVKEKGGKPDRNPYPFPYGLRNPYRNLKSDNSQDYAEKLYVYEFGFRRASQRLCCDSKRLLSYFHRVINISYHRINKENYD
jgi:hypothetical protein